MPTLPAFISRPDASLPAAEPVAGPAYATVTLALDSGVPFRIPLDGTRSLLLAVPLGQLRRWMGDDPSTVIVDTTVTSLPVTPPGPTRNLDNVGPRLTLLLSGAVGDTTSFATGSPATLTMNGQAVVEVVVDELTITVGSIRSPGQYGSSISLRWRDLHPAPNSGPPDAVLDPSIPRKRLAFYLQARTGEQIG